MPHSCYAKASRPQKRRYARLFVARPLLVKRELAAMRACVASAANAASIAATFRLAFVERKSLR